MEPIDLTGPAYDGWFDKVCQLREPGETLIKGLSTKTLVPATGFPDVIECNVQPSGGRQVQLGPSEFAISTHLVYLRGHYPVKKGTLVPVVEAQNHELLYVEQDGADCCTVLVTRSSS